MSIPPNIRELAQQLHESAQRDLAPDQWANVQAARAGIRGVIEIYGDMGKVALSLCAADFAAE